MPRPRLSLAGALTAMLAVSCTNPGFVCGCSPAEPYALIYGKVTDGAGAPVAGARITAEQGEAGCTAPIRSLNGARIESGTDGSYRAMLHPPVPPRPGDCLRAYAAAPEGSALAGSDTVAFAVRFLTGTSTPDSARVDLVLRTP